MPKPLVSFLLENPAAFHKKALGWASQFSHCISLDHNGLHYPYGGFRKLLAVGCQESVQTHPGQKSFEVLRAFHQEKRPWLFGFFSYDLKNELEALESKNNARIAVPPLSFFSPRFLLEFVGKQVIVHLSETAPSSLFQQIQAYHSHPAESFQTTQIVPQVTRTEYLQNVRAIQEHILNGDVYELNYCIEFFADKAVLDPLTFFQQLNWVSPMPFAAYLKMGSLHAACASPERFLKKSGDTLIAQPVKGTAKRGGATVEDLKQKENLFNSEKERAENLMIVDLVRNDLARSAVAGSVEVEELFQIMGFRHIYQMLSTVKARLRLDVGFTEAIAHAFPMGSMTGAPKVRAMQLIEQYEKTRRGLYSGAIGYITPEGDFDFNVVIRSLLYDAVQSTLSFEVGSAITSDAQPREEYQECLLKAQSIQSVLAGENVL